MSKRDRIPSRKDRFCPRSRPISTNSPEDISLRGIEIPILVDNTTGEVIDGKLRKQIADELEIREIPTIYVGRLTPEERADLRLAVNLYRRHLTQAQIER